MTTAESYKTAISSGSGIVLMTLASGQFLMTLDSSVMTRTWIALSSRRVCLPRPQMRWSR
jgi:hypothetical protein